MPDYIVGTEAFTKNLDSWLLKSDQSNADFLFRNKEKIPPVFRNYTRTLYRGMIADNAFLQKLDKTGSVKLDRHTSWTKDESIAIKFLKDEKFNVQNKNGKMIIIEKQFARNDQILDIDAFVLFMGAEQLQMIGYDEMNIDSALKEKEVLIGKGAVITKKNVNFIS